MIISIRLLPTRKHLHDYVIINIYITSMQKISIENNFYSRDRKEEKDWFPLKKCARILILHASYPRLQTAFDKLDKFGGVGLG